MQTLNVLVFGSGAREHAIADSISKSPLLKKLYLVQCGCFDIGEEIKFANYDDLAKKCLEKKIDIAIFGPEEPLCKGIVDVFEQYGIKCIGVDKYFSQLESSKLFGKKFMQKYEIKTADYQIIKDTNYSVEKFPIVVKADGLCKGKGVVIAYSKEELTTTVNEFLSGKFDENSKTILLEKFLEGEEISLMSLFDGENLLHFVPSRDFKKINNLPDSPNTGGMGAFCPVFLSEEQNRKLKLYKKQLQNALIQENAKFKGFIYSGLIWAKNDWYVLEYNVRLGDPETQVILTHLETDFLGVLKAAVEQKLDTVELKYKNGYSACLVVAAEGYPQQPKDGEEITIPKQDKVKLFFAGVEKMGGKLYSKGGRILSLCLNDKNPFPILKEFAETIKMDNKYFRKDIDITTFRP